MKLLKRQVGVVTFVFTTLVAVAIAWINLGMPTDASALRGFSLPSRVAWCLVLVASVVVSALTALPGTHFKTQLVFLRGKNPLPGSRAFSETTLARDSRIDRTRLREAVGGKFPSSPREQNAVWYRLFKSVESDPRVGHLHYEFLLFRDLTWLSVFLLAVAAASAQMNPSSRPAILYALAGQVFLLAVFWMAARERGLRFVTTVLAVAAANPKSDE